MGRAPLQVPGHARMGPGGGGLIRISMGNAHAQERARWRLLIKCLPHPRQGLSGICVQWPPRARDRNVCMRNQSHFNLICVSTPNCLSVVACNS